VPGLGIYPTAFKLISARLGVSFAPNDEMDTFVVVIKSGTVTIISSCLMTSILTIDHFSATFSPE
jgi:hypothetical protein